VTVTFTENISGGVSTITCNVCHDVVTAELRHAAEHQRAQAALDAARERALEVQCPTCYRMPGNFCVSLSAGSKNPTPHVARVRSAAARIARRTAARAS
jgi:hypothetical protein